MKNFILYLCICMLASEAVVAQSLNITRTTDQYDKLVAEWMANNTAETFENMMNDYVILDTATYLQAVSPFTQSQYIERLKNIVSPVQLPYNDIIHKHLVAYTTTHRSLTSRMLGQSQCYFPMIEEALARHGLPLELKYITIIESALQPTAKSYAGAVGLWQLMLNTGRHYGLEITSMVDQRRDPVKSTEAACRFLKDMYAIYPDWTLVLACYNYGPGNVSKAIARAGGSKNKTLTYWDIYPYLPKQTRDYVPAFIGITYAFHYYKDHNITPVGPSLPVAVDTVMIDRNMHFEQVASTMGIPVEMIRILNPQYTQDLIPGNTKPYPLALPLSQLSNFIACQEEIFAKDSIYIEQKYISSVIPATPAKTGSVYTVKSGDTLSAIAKRNGTTVAKIKQWNNLTSDKLREGQKLKMNA